MKHGSDDIRKMVIDGYKEGRFTQTEASRITGYSRATIGKWCRNEAYTSKPRGHRAAAFSDEELSLLAEFLENNKDATLLEIKEHFNKKCSISSVFRAVEKTKFTFKKKSLHADERDSEEVIAARKEFLEKILKINPYALNFLDESATRTDMTRKYGRSYKGKRCVDSTPGSWKTLTLMASFNLNGDISPVVFPGALNRITFEKCLEKFILPSIQPGHTLILDNLSSHKSELITKLCKDRGVNLIYLPPYSPDLNPIEKLWSKVKSVLRSIKARTTEALEEAINKALDTVTLSDIRGWYREAGYAA